MSTLPLSLRALALGAALLLVPPAGRAAHAQAKPRPGVVGPTRPVPPPKAPKGPSTAAPSTAKALPDSTRPLAVRGVLLDSTSMTPLPDAMVQLASEGNRDLTFTTRTDAGGRWRIEGVRPGRYLAGFFHQSIDALGIETPVVLVEIRPDTAVQLDLGMPGAATVRATVCPRTPPDRGVLYGLVRDAESGELIPEAKVVVTWSEVRIGEDGVRNVRRRLPVKVRPDGGFLVCDLPVETDLVANAEAPGRRGGLVEVRLLPRTVERRDFALGDSTSVIAVTIPDTMAAKEGRLAQPTTVARGRAVLQGTIRGRDGRPLQGARVQLWGSDVSGAANDAGNFTLSGLPSGTYALEVRAIGFAPKRVAVNLSSRTPTQVAVVLDQRVNTLQSVVVQADRSKLQKDFTGFAERAKRGMGRYVTEEDIEKRGAIMASDVFRTIPGIQVVPNGTGFGYALLGRGQCQPDVFIDGMRVFGGAQDLDQLVRPQDLAGVEVYNGAGTVPAQFMSGGTGGCGVVAMWTKRGR